MCRKFLGWLKFIQIHLLCQSLLMTGFPLIAFSNTEEEVISKEQVIKATTIKEAQKDDLIHEKLKNKYEEMIESTFTVLSNIEKKLINRINRLGADDKFTFNPKKAFFKDEHTLKLHEAFDTDLVQVNGKTIQLEGDPYANILHELLIGLDNEDNKGIFITIQEDLLSDDYSDKDKLILANYYLNKIVLPFRTITTLFQQQNKKEFKDMIGQLKLLPKIKLNGEVTDETVLSYINGTPKKKLEGKLSQDIFAEMAQNMKSDNVLDENPIFDFHGKELKLDAQFFEIIKNSEQRIDSSNNASEITINYNSEQIVHFDMMSILKAPTQYNYLMASKWFTTTMLIKDIEKMSNIADLEARNIAIPKSCTYEQGGNLPNTLPLEKLSDRERSESFQRLLESNGFVSGTKAHKDFYMDGVNLNPIFPGFMGVSPFEDYELAKKAVNQTKAKSSLELSPIFNAAHTLDDLVHFNSVFQSKVSSLLGKIKADDEFINSCPEFTKVKNPIFSQEEKDPEEIATDHLRQSFMFLLTLEDSDYEFKKNVNGKEKTYTIPLSGLPQYLSNLLRTKKIDNQDIVDYILSDNSNLKSSLDNKYTPKFPAINTTSYYKQLLIPTFYQFLLKIKNENLYEKYANIIKETCLETTNAYSSTGKNAFKGSEYRATNQENLLKREEVSSYMLSTICFKKDVNKHILKALSQSSFNGIKTNALSKNINLQESSTNFINRSLEILAPFSNGSEFIPNYQFTKDVDGINKNLTNLNRNYLDLATFWNKLIEKKDPIFSEVTQIKESDFIKSQYLQGNPWAGLKLMALTMEANENQNSDKLFLGISKKLLPFKFNDKCGKLAFKKYRPVLEGLKLLSTSPFSYFHSNKVTLYDKNMLNYGENELRTSIFKKVIEDYDQNNLNLFNLDAVQNTKTYSTENQSQTTYYQLLKKVANSSLIDRESIYKLLDQLPLSNDVKIEVEENIEEAGIRLIQKHELSDLKQIENIAFFAKKSLRNNKITLEEQVSNYSKFLDHLSFDSDDVDESREYFEIKEFFYDADTMFKMPIFLALIKDAARKKLQMNKELLQALCDIQHDFDKKFTIHIPFAPMVIGKGGENLKALFHFTAKNQETLNKVMGVETPASLQKYVNTMSSLEVSAAWNSLSSMPFIIGGTVLLGMSCVIPGVNIAGCPALLATLATLSILYGAYLVGHAVYGEYVNVHNHRELQETIKKAYRAGIASEENVAGLDKTYFGMALELFFTIPLVGSLGKAIHFWAKAGQITLKATYKALGNGSFKLVLKQVAKENQAHNLKRTFQQLRGHSPKMKDIVQEVEQSIANIDDEYQLLMAKSMLNIDKLGIGDIGENLSSTFKNYLQYGKNAFTKNYTKAAKNIAHANKSLKKILIDSAPKEVFPEISDTLKAIDEVDNRFVKTISENFTSSDLLKTMKSFVKAPLGKYRLLRKKLSNGFLEKIDNVMANRLGETSETRGKIFYDFLEELENLSVNGSKAQYEKFLKENSDLITAIGIHKPFRMRDFPQMILTGAPMMNGTLIGKLLSKPFGVFTRGISLKRFATARDLLIRRRIRQDALSELGLSKDLLKAKQSLYIRSFFETTENVLNEMSDQKLKNMADDYISYKQEMASQILEMLHQLKNKKGTIFSKISKKDAFQILNEKFPDLMKKYMNKDSGAENFIQLIGNDSLPSKESAFLDVLFELLPAEMFKSVNPAKDEISSVLIKELIEDQSIDSLSRRMKLLDFQLLDLGKGKVQSYKFEYF